MSEPATITSPHVPDVDDVREWLEKMIKSLRFVELVVAIVAFVTRMRDLNTELTRRVADLRTCPLCGEEMRTVVHSTCEILDVRPAELFVRQRLTERIACPNDDTIVSAPTPPELVERGKLGTALIVEALADKFLEHQPIERQCLRWSRTGVDIAPQTLGRSVGAAIDALVPVARMIEQQTRAPGLLATDATGIPVLDRDAPDGIRQGTIWCWTNARWVSFIY